MLFCVSKKTLGSLFPTLTFFIILFFIKRNFFLLITLMCLKFSGFPQLLSSTATLPKTADRFSDPRRRFERCHFGRYNLK